jgi:hypothetical protein
VLLRSQAPVSIGGWLDVVAREREASDECAHTNRMTVDSTWRDCEVCVSTRETTLVKSVMARDVELRLSEGFPTKLFAVTDPQWRLFVIVRALVRFVGCLKTLRCTPLA